MTMTDLTDYLFSIPFDSYVNEQHLEELLLDCWIEFEGNTQEGMEPYKLRRRIENIEWNPPIITFIIERHGRTVHGSTRADIQKWELNVLSKIATCTKISHRQLTPMATRVNVKEICKEIVHLILDHSQDDRIEWLSDKEVKIKIGSIFPEGSAFKQTLTNRKKKFHEYLDLSLKTNGWNKKNANHYSLTKQR